MLTLRAAAALLQGADDRRGLTSLAAACGFDGPPLPIDHRLSGELGLPDLLLAPALVKGPALLRALLIETPPDGRLREHVTRIAAALRSRTPHLRWLLLGSDGPGGHVMIASFAIDTPRVASLCADRHRVKDSDAETLAALAAAIGGTQGTELLAHARWLDILGRESLTRRFYRTLERHVTRLGADARATRERTPDLADRSQFALITVSRLLFLAFLEAKGWLDADRAFLRAGFDRCMLAGGHYHRRILRPLFFGTLNTPVSRRAPTARALGRIPFLNGGLFTPSALDRRCRLIEFDDAALGALFADVFDRYRFTAREESTTLSDAAVDPEMLGRAFESLMADETRRSSGAYYTPHELVAHVTIGALRAWLEREGDQYEISEILSGCIPAGARDRVRDDLSQVRLLDPACGSGAFLVHAMETIADLLARLGDARSVAERRRAVLAHSIFGVDTNPIAVWLCELRLWLSVVIETDATDPMRVPPLPNLDHHVRVGDSIAGADFGVATAAREGRALARLRERYVRASGTRKRWLARHLDREERARAISHAQRSLEILVEHRRDLVCAARNRDLFGKRATPDSSRRSELEHLRRQVRGMRQTLRSLRDGAALPFSYAVHFADAAAECGFDLVIGNPPWVRLHNIPAATRTRYLEEFAVYRDAAWKTGAAIAGAGRGFASQVDLAALFIERGIHLTRPGGACALLVPAKLWRSLAGGGVRRLLRASTDVTAIEDWSEAPSSFDAAVYPSMVVARVLGDARRPVSAPDTSIDDGLWSDSDGPTNAHPYAEPAARIGVYRGDTLLRWAADIGEIALDDSTGAPWLLLPAPALSAFHSIRDAGIPLAHSEFGRPLLGVKCGCNDAFIIADRVADAESLGLDIEPELLRPLLRGETLQAWTTSPTDERILWTHHARGAPLERLPPRALRHLQRWRPQLESRTDLHGRGAWWSLFRTEAADASFDRVAWSDFGRRLTATVLPAGDSTVPLNTCYVVRCRALADAHALAAILNSFVASAWLYPLAEPARGGWRRYLGWTMALLPLPRDWARARCALAPLAAEACAGRTPPDHVLTEIVADAYGLSLESLAPLLEWASDR